MSRTGAPTHLLELAAARVIDAAARDVWPDGAPVRAGRLELPFAGFFIDVARRPITADDLLGVAAAMERRIEEDIELGPDLPRSGACRFFRLWMEAIDIEDDAEGAAPLARIAGIIRSDADALEREQARLERASERDHRRIGRERSLFAPSAAGGDFLWLPRGAAVRSAVIDATRARLARAGFLEVSTPFGRAADHAAVFRAEPRGESDLPLRLLEVVREGREAAPPGSAGLRRSRQATRDALTVFCLPEAVEDELARIAALARELHERLELPFRARIGSSPGAFAPEALSRIAAALGVESDTEESAGFRLRVDFDARNLFGLFEHRLGRIEVMPGEGLEPLECIRDRPPGRRKEAPEAASRLDIIRASLWGDLEGLIAAVIESSGGAFPSWTAPVQAIVMSITTEVEAYAREVRETLAARGVRCDLDVRRTKVLTKFRDAIQEQIPWTVVIGEKEAESRTATLRRRGAFESPVEMPLEELVARAALELPAGE